MSNRYAKQISYQLEQDVYRLFANATIGAAGAVSSTKGMGITSIAKQATAGQYIVTLSEPYNRFLKLNADVVAAAISGVASVQMLATPSTMQASIQSSRQLTIQCVDYAGAAVNPPSGSQIMLNIQMRNSSIGPND